LVGDIENKNHMLKKTRKIIPFGKVIEGGRQTFPQNEVYLGREKKRQQLMRWLTSLKPSGSILVTGARGVGKSTFVKNVIGSMNVNLYERLCTSSKPFGPVAV